MKENNVRVAISGFSGLNNPHPGLPVARALREGWKGRIEIHALGYDGLMTGAWMPGAVDRLHTMPSLNAGDEAVFERILEIHDKVRLDAVIPCLDLEVPVFSRLAGRLRRRGIAMLLPSPEAVYAVTKLRLPVFCHANDIRTPKTIHVLDTGDVALHAEQFGFPCMVKGTVAGAKKVGSTDQARKAAQTLNERWGGGVLLQEYLVGEEIVAAAVVGPSQACLGLVAMRKLGINPDGKCVFGAVIDDPAVDAETRRILDKLNWRGPLELEFIRPRGSGNLYLVEINCRFPSWTMLSHFAGCNLPVMSLRALLDSKSVPSKAKPRPGTMFVRDLVETTVPLKLLGQLERQGGAPGMAPKPRRRAADADGGLRVAVTGFGSNDVVNAGHGVAASLRGVSGVASVYGFGYGAYDSGLYRRDVLDASFRLPQDDDPDVLLERLAEIHREAPFDVVIPCMDGEIPRFIAIEPALAKLGVRMLLPTKKALEQCAKPNLFTGRGRRDWGGFEIPAAMRAKSERDAVAAVRRSGFPAVVKGPVSEAIEVANEWETQAAWLQMREKGIEEVLVQPKISGDHFAVAGICDRGHEARALLTVRKLMRCDRGSTWSALTVRQPELERAFAAFLKHVRWRGPVEGEFIRDDRTDRFNLIEVNPRFTAWISYSAALGVNHPWHSVCLAVDRPFEPKPVDADLVFMRSCWELPVPTLDFAAISTRGSVRHE